MPAKYLTSKLADHDIKQIVKRSLNDFGESQTSRYMNGMRAVLQTLAENPDSGRVFTHRNSGAEYLRHTYVSHVVYYRKRQDDIFVVRILHAKMLPENHL